MLTIDNEIEVYAPNIIRPGSNSWFTIFGSSGIRSVLELTIYDRWGNRMYHQEDIPPNQPDLGWNGTSNGRQVVPGVYVWHARILTQDGRILEKAGDVTVVR